MWFRVKAARDGAWSRVSPCALSSRRHKVACGQADVERDTELVPDPIRKSKVTRKQEELAGVAEDEADEADDFEGDAVPPLSRCSGPRPGLRVSQCTDYGTNSLLAD